MIKYLDELKALNLPRGEYALFGTAVLAAHGIKENKDLDVLVRPRTWDEMKKRYEPYKPSVIQIGNVEFCRDLLPWLPNAEEFIDSAELINGIPVVRLEHLAAWKKIRNLEKDRADLKLIDEYSHH